MYKILVRKRKKTKWKTCNVEGDFFGAENGLFRSKTRAAFLAAEIAEATGYYTRVRKV